MKNTLKKVLSFTLTLALVFSLIPVGTVVANAADISMSASGLGASTSGSGTWTGGGTSVSGTVSGKDGTFSFLNSTQDGTLTFTNNRSTAAKISFNYNITVNTGSVTIGGTTVTGSGTHTADISAGGTLAIKITSGKGSSNTTAIDLTNISLFVDVSATTTFAVAENGTYTVNGTQITAATPFTQSSTVAYALVASPAAGYKLKGWYSTADNAFISDATSVSVNIEADTTVYPVFILETIAVFKVGATKYYDLNDANAAAVAGSDKTIVVVGNGTISAGTYEISSGVKLLVPHSASDAGDFDEKPALLNYNSGESRQTLKPYSTLTLGDGAVINCYGQINVNGVMYVQGGSPTSIITGSYGAIDMVANSKINLESGSILYAYGFVGGEGTVEAKNGSKVYQFMQLMDWRGGSVSSSVKDTMKGNSFIFSQYYLQNIESYFKVNCGASMMAVAGLTMKSITTVEEQIATAIIGTTEGLFRFDANSPEDYILMKYDATTDRMNLDLYGDISTQNISLAVNLGIGFNFDFNTNEYILPLPMNYSIDVMGGSTVSFTEKFKLQPGTEIYVHEGATVNISSNGAVYIYDADDWNTGVYVYLGTAAKNLSQLPYVHARKGAPVSRVPNKDAVLHVDGTLNAQGPIYTTKSAENGGGAGITGNGTIVLTQYGTTNLKEIKDNNADTIVEIPCIPVVGNIAGHSGLNSFATGTYKSINGVWYQYKIENEGFTVQSGGHADENNIYVGTTKDSSSVNLVVNTTYPCVQLSGVTQTNDGNGTYTVTAIAENAKMSAKEHTVVTNGESKDATCLESGMAPGTQCSECGVVLSEPTVLPMTGHSYTDWVATTPVTCTTAGVDTRTCTVCGTTETRDVVPLGHSYVEIPAVAPTCDVTGLTAGEHCENCGQVTIPQDVVAALGHNYNEGVVTTLPSCDTAGEKTFTCQTCSGTYTEVVNALGHAEEELPAVAATCTTDGLTAGSKCTRCEEIIVPQTVVPATGHSNIRESTTAATCVKNGTITRRCLGCRTVVETITIPALGHSDENADGFCDTCGEISLIGKEQTEVIYTEEIIFTQNEDIIETIDDIITVGSDITVTVEPSQNSTSACYGTGTIITAKNADATKIKTFKLVVYGDLNGDGVCDVLDAMVTSQYANGLAEPTPIEICAANLSSTDADKIDVNSYSQIVNKAIS